MRDEFRITPRLVCENGTQGCGEVFMADEKCSDSVRVTLVTRVCARCKTDRAQAALQATASAFQQMIDEKFGKKS